MHFCTGGQESAHVANWTASKQKTVLRRSPRSSMRWWLVHSQCVKLIGSDLIGRVVSGGQEGAHVAKSTPPGSKYIVPAAPVPSWATQSPAVLDFARSMPQACDATLRSRWRVYSVAALNSAGDQAASHENGQNYEADRVCVVVPALYVRLCVVPKQVKNINVSMAVTEEMSCRPR